MIRILCIHLLFFLTGCFIPCYTRTGERTEAELDGYWTRTISYKRASISFPQNKRWPRYTMGKTKKYTYDSTGTLRRLQIRKSSGYGFSGPTEVKTKEYDQKGRRIKKRKK